MRAKIKHLLESMLQHLELLKRDADSMRGITDGLLRLAIAFQDTGNDVAYQKLMNMRHDLYLIRDRMLVSIETLENQASERNELNDPNTN